MSEQPCVLRLQLAGGDGRVFTAVRIPKAARVETSGVLLGVDDFGGRVGDGVSVLIVATDDIAAVAGPVRPGEEPA